MHLLLPACQIHSCEPAGSGTPHTQHSLFSETSNARLGACVCTDYGQGCMVLLP